MFPAVGVPRARYGMMPAVRTSVRRVALIQAVCTIVFGVDLAIQLHGDLLQDQILTGWQSAHLITETVAVGLLFLGFALARSELRGLVEAEARQRGTLADLRGHFDDILVKQFKAWGLSKAESDIALLSLRGLKISEIAAHRRTKEGTIKAQLSAIFHKAGIGTRTELLGLFMDEFLDFGAAQDQPQGPDPRPMRL